MSGARVRACAVVVRPGFVYVAVNVAETQILLPFYRALQIERSNLHARRIEENPRKEKMHSTAAAALCTIIGIASKAGGWKGGLALETRIERRNDGVLLLMTRADAGGGSLYV